ncbi:MAG TPA: hypothetical protein PKU83_04580 [Chryseolinea sp.]|nr:hypothetical protein [Chryseolinea sp.]
MKKVAVIMCALVLGACTKDYKCTVVTDHTYMGSTFHSEATVDFRGTKDEMEAYEAKGTKDTPSVKQVTTCKK